MLRRALSRAGLLCAVSALAACSRDQATGPAPLPSIVGDYTLALVDGVRVPTVPRDFPVRYEGGSLVIHPDSIFELNVEMYAPGTQVELCCGRLGGTYHWTPTTRALVLESLLAQPPFQLAGTATVDTIRLGTSADSPASAGGWWFTFVRARP